MQKNPIQGKPKTIAELYPELTPEQQEEAAYHLRQYLIALWDIYATNNGLKKHTAQRGIEILSSLYKR